MAPVAAPPVPKLITWGPVGNTHSSVSSFGAKVEVGLRFAGIDYTVQPGDPTDSKVYVKRKFPVLQAGDQIIPDSSDIFQYLHETYPEEMAIFTPSDTRTRAFAQALQRMLEEHAYFGVAYGACYADDVASEYAPRVIKTFFPVMDENPILRATIPLVRKMTESTMARDLHGQGMGRHSMEEVLSRLDADLAACNTLLEESGAFLTGATPTQADCFLFGLLDHGLHACEGMTVPFVHTHLIKEKPALMAFHARVAAKVFPNGRSEKWLQVT